MTNNTTLVEFTKQAHTQSVITRLTKAGAPRPAGSSPLWNEWAANNPQPETLALAKVDVTGNITPLLKAIATGARPIEL